MKTSALVFILLTTIVGYEKSCRAQFSPAAGQAGSIAIYKDSSAFTQWATGCTVVRGRQNISIAEGPLANYGNEDNATGIADGTVVSLGDSGIAIVNFDSPIYNGPGPDFAVFENSFDGQFLELGFVEVSSDGINFVRFPSTSLTDTTNQIGTFGMLNPEKINNLAGTFRALYGTPFDLDELKNITGLDVDNITHVRIIDVVGSINPLYASRDAAGRIINDPWPTPFASGGFDLDAVGVIHSKGNSVKELDTKEFHLFPTQTKSGSLLTFYAKEKIREINLISLDATRNKLDFNSSTLMLPELQPSVYFIEFTTNQGRIIKKIVIEE